MAQLSDLRYPVSIQGILALVNCLPTDYKGYEQILPKWIELWIGRNNRYFCMFWCGDICATLVLHRHQFFQV